MKIILFVLLVVPLLATLDTSRLPQTSCQRAYSSCRVGYDSPGETSSLRDDEASLQIAASMDQGQQRRTLVEEDSLGLPLSYESEPSESS